MQPIYHAFFLILRSIHSEILDKIVSSWNKEIDEF